MILPTNFTDQKIDSSQNVNRRYIATKNNDDTYSFTDVTIYENEGSAFSADNMNSTNTQINTNTNKIGNATLKTVAQSLTSGINEICDNIDEVNDSIDEINDNLTANDGEPFRYAKVDGKRGMWVKEADTDVFVPFKSGIDVLALEDSGIEIGTTESKIFEGIDFTKYKYISVKTAAPGATLQKCTVLFDGESKDYQTSAVMTSAHDDRGSGYYRTMIIKLTEDGVLVKTPQLTTIIFEIIGFDDDALASFVKLHV